MGLSDWDGKYFNHLADVWGRESTTGYASALHRDDGVDQDVEVALSLGDGVADALRRCDYADRVLPNVLDVSDEGGGIGGRPGVLALS